MANISHMADVQFENANEMRMYPFAEDASLRDVNGRQMPLDAISDIRMVVPDHYENPESSFLESSLPVVRMSSLHISKHMVSACFATEFLGSKCALSISVARGNFRPYFPYRMDNLSGSANIGGYVSFGNVEFPDFPETYFFDDARLAPCCIAVASPPRLTGFVDQRSGDKVSGDVEIEFSGYIETEKDGDSFRLSLEDGAGETLASECQKKVGNDSCGATPITSINWVSPDKHGNIVLWFH